MNEPVESGAPRPLPQEWLPAPNPPEPAPVWDARARRVMAAADPHLRRLRKRRAVAETTWPSVLGLWWKPVTALAAAATALLLLTGRPPAPPELPQGSLTLNLIAAEGDPTTLWKAFGVQADPVLAWIALRGRRTIMGQSSGDPPSPRAFPAISEGEKR